MHPLNSLLNSQGFVILDGGLATELEARGENLNDPLWSARVLLEAPEKIEQLHYDYFAAGADVATTASYQATIPGLMAHGLSAPEAEAVIRKSVDLALAARDRIGRPGGLVAASIGPYGAYLHDGSEYRGDYNMTAVELKAFHHDRLSILATSGADLIACESFPSLLEAEVMLDLLSEFPNARAWMSFTCRDGRHISDGTLFSDAVAVISKSPAVLAVGVNCTAPHYISDLLCGAKSTKPLLAYPNSGECYNASSASWSENSEEDVIARSTSEWYSLGARLLGGCCRTTAATIAAIRRALLSSEVIGAQRTRMRAAKEEMDSADLRGVLGTAAVLSEFDRN